MWDASTSKISQQTLIQGIEDGGLTLCHFPTKVKSLILAWVKGSLQSLIQHGKFYQNCFTNVKT